MALFVKLDTSFWEHPKVLAAGEQAAVLYLQMLCYAQANLTDGFVPDAQLGRFGIRKANVRVAKLIDSELIQRRSEDDGWAIVGYTERNRSRAEVEEIRDKRRSAGMLGGKASGRVRSKVLHDVEVNGKQVASTVSNPEHRAQSSDHRAAPPAPPPSDDPGPAPAPDRALVLLADQMIQAAMQDPTVLADAAQRQAVAEVLDAGHPPSAVLTAGVDAAGGRNPKGLLRAILLRLASEPPVTAPPNSSVEPCPNPACVNGNIGGHDDAGRPEPVTRCPDCTGVRA